MAAATKERDTPTSHYDLPVSLKQKGAVKIWNGTIVCVDANGLAIPGADTAGIRAMGRASETSDTAGIADAVNSCEALIGVCEFNNPAGANSLTQVDVGKLAYVLTDQDICRAAGTVNSVIAGKVLSVDVTNAKATIDFRQKVGA